jgi:hypothetical protein
MFRLSIALMMGVSAALPLVRQLPPPDLAELTFKARLTGTIVSYCPAEFEAGRTGAYALAVISPDGNGRYVAVHPDATMQEIIPFSHTGELSCYTSVQALKLHDTIQKSRTLYGSLEPRFDSTVVCTFVDDTTATCWQYSPAARDFVKVGQWRTTQFRPTPPAPEQTTAQLRSRTRENRIP